MCGILGGITRAGVDFSHESVERALSKLRHRGPDADGIFFAKDAFLGHRRLSIVDIDRRANQPMKRGSCVISFNGEIYNHRDLRRNLEHRGHRFYTTSDTEVLLAAYMEFGAACLDKLEGMFAFAIWDERERSLFLARDRFGEKPLFYYCDNKWFLFSSELAPIRLLLPSSRLDEDRSALGLYFLFSYIPAPYTPYKNCFQLEPGCWLKMDAEQWSLTKSRYYDLRNAVSKDKSPSYSGAVEMVRENLEDAVRSRFVTSDVPVATFLSGGIDSSIISLLAARATSEPVTAYSIAFPEEPEFDESPFAASVAAVAPNLHHRIVPVTEATLESFLDDTLALLSEPFADSSLIPTAYLCAQVEEKVILGGDGADELFGGYGVYSAIGLSARLPAILKRLLLALPSPRNPHAVRHPSLRALALFLEHLDETPVDEYLGWRQYADVDDVRALNFNIDLLPNIRRDVEFVGSGYLRDVQTADFAFNMPNDMLKKVDYASMFHSLEVRLPYLETRLVETVLSFPDSYKIQGRRRKRVLRDAFSTLLPESVLNRRKQGFLLPLRRWFRKGILNEKLRRLIEEQTIFDRCLLRRRLADHAIGKMDNSVFLWSLFVFLYWREVQARHIEI